MALKRSELKQSDTWRLEDMFLSDADWNACFDGVSGRIAELGEFQGKLGELATLIIALNLNSELELAAGNLFCYAKMRRDEDNNNPVYQALLARAQSLEVALSTAASFIAPELTSLGADYMTRATNLPEFKDYDVLLKELIRRAPHTLSEAEERIVAMAGELLAAPSTVYDMLSDADMRFPTIAGADGKPVQITQASYIQLLMSADRKVRKAAFDGYYGTYRQFSATVPALYQASVNADMFLARTAKFDSALHAALFPDDVPHSVYDNLIDVVHQHLGGLNRLVMINARLNGLDAPEMYDVYVPSPFGFDINLAFDEAYELVVDSLKIFGDDYIDALRRARAERWIDPFENEGKSSGAYSWGTYDSNPYVLMNYHDNLDGLLTIAHEMGHSMHSYYSNRNQPYPKSQYSLFVAEVASTVNEVLVLMELLDRNKTHEAQAYLLYNLLESYRSTLFRQTMFAEFEMAAHAMAEGGGVLTIESLNGLYQKLNAEYYSSAIQTDGIECEWMRIPHFYRAFYVYKYATGFSAAMALAAKIRAEGEPAVAAYKRFLSSGSSLSPIEALKVAGIDMSRRDAVESALDTFEALLDRYEAITNESR